MSRLSNVVQSVLECSRATVMEYDQLNPNPDSNLSRRVSSAEFLRGKATEKKLCLHGEPLRQCKLTDYFMVRISRINNSFSELKYLVGIAVGPSIKCASRRSGDSMNTEQCRRRHFTSYYPKFRYHCV